MRKYRAIRITVLLILLLGIRTYQFAQSAPAGPGKSAEERRATAIALVRAINTSEAVELQTRGSFAAWETLLSHHAEYIDKCMRQNGIRLGSMPEVLPGWNLRLNVRQDGKAYDLMLEDVANKQVPYGAYSNETGMIWDAAPIH
ncbi:MAG TPA: hypothetical protein VLW54_08905 [Candidatus Acidoferrales bacterium]|nr:hypothetical protein [Candidatus Acidoferrales bacterium]